MITFLSMKISINVGLVLLNIGLFFFCLQLYRKNRRLKQKIVRLEQETKEILERKIVKESANDLVSIQNISGSSSNKSSNPISKDSVKEDIRDKDTKEKKRVSVQTNKREEVSSKKDVKERDNSFTTLGERDHQKVVASKEKQEKKAYQKNVFQNKKTVTSPISISNQDSFNMNKLSFDLNEFIKKSEKIVPKIKESASKKDYLKAISDQMAEELKPQTIELTDYEKEQEEHAIISYQELLAVKDKITMLDDEDETVDFIEELKNFRNSLD